MSVEPKVIFERSLKRSVNTPNLSVGKAGLGRGYHLKNLGVKLYDPNKKCPHCHQALAIITEIFVIPHDGSDHRVNLVCGHCYLNIEK